MSRVHNGPRIGLILTIAALCVSASSVVSCGPPVVSSPAATSTLPLDGERRRERHDLLVNIAVALLAQSLGSFTERAPPVHPAAARVIGRLLSVAGEPETIEIGNSTCTTGRILWRYHTAPGQPGEVQWIAGSFPTAVRDGASSIVVRLDGDADVWISVSALPEPMLRAPGSRMVRLTATRTSEVGVASGEWIPDYGGLFPDRFRLIATTRGKSIGAPAAVAPPSANEGIERPDAPR